MRIINKLRRGDTLIEVMFSVTVFALVIVISVNLMNGGLNTAQKTLETTMTRNEMAALVVQAMYGSASRTAQGQQTPGPAQEQERTPLD